MPCRRQDVGVCEGTGYDATSKLSNPVSRMWSKGRVRTDGRKHFDAADFYIETWIVDGEKLEGALDTILEQDPYTETQILSQMKLIEPRL